MRCFVTGSTGFIGNNLVNELVRSGHQVNILVRNRKDPFHDNRNVKVFHGDLFDIEAIERAVRGCDFIFHLAAYANIWSKDKTLAYKTNVTGTKNILDTALSNRVKKVVFTSSAATLPPSENDELIDERDPLPDKYLTEYEATKYRAEKLCIEYCRKGLDVVIVNPSRVYGPGILNKSNSVTILIKKYNEGKWRIIPGDGAKIGNYVFIDDVVNGHILALKYGKPGEKYILGGINISYNDFFHLLSEVSGKNFRLFHLPMSLMMLVGKFELFMAENFGKRPLITPPWIKRYQQNRPISSNKAVINLNYSVTTLEEGLHKTLEWLKIQKNEK